MDTPHESVTPQEVFNFITGNPRYQLYLIDLIRLRLNQPTSPAAGECFSYLVDHARNCIAWPDCSLKDNNGKA